MRNLLIFMFLVAVFVLGNRSCDGLNFTFGGIRGKGPVQTETRTASGFHAIDLSLAGDIEVTVAEQYAVEVSTQENLLSALKTEVTNGVLRIYSDKNLNSSEPIKIKVSAPTFDQFLIFGSGSITVLNALQSETMNMEISGSGDISCDQGDFERMKASISGSGDIKLGGNAANVKMSISGSGDVKAADFKVETLSVRIAGAGSVRAHVETELTADIIGSGDVYYTGSPIVESNVSGSGSVKRVRSN